MRISNTTSPNFGLSISIEKGALYAIQDYKNLPKAVNLLSQTSGPFVLRVNKNNTTAIATEAGEVLSGKSIKLFEPSDNKLRFNATWIGSNSNNLKSGETIVSAIKFASKEAALKAYNNITSEPSEMVRVAQIVDYLDNAEPIFKNGNNEIRII